jgi:hypothetical protein
MNKHGKFWLTFGSILTLLYLFTILIIFVNCNDNNVLISKWYIVPVLPLLILNGFQFMVNYISLTEN